MTPEGQILPFLWLLRRVPYSSLDALLSVDANAAACLLTNVDVRLLFLWLNSPLGRFPGPMARCMMQLSRARESSAIAFSRTVGHCGACAAFLCRA